MKEREKCWFCEGKGEAISQGGAKAYFYQAEYSISIVPQIRYDNSGGEYAEGYLPINYCPLCGKNLRETEK